MVGDGEAVLGATGFFASVDVLVELERVPDAPDSQRQLISIGRWPQTPAALVVDRSSTSFPIFTALSPAEH